MLSVNVHRAGVNMACVSCSAQVKVTGKLQIEAQYSNPTGRCCVGETCSVVVEGSCGGYWAGAGSVCPYLTVLNQCKQYGACCIDTENCELRNYDDVADCTYLGNGTWCGGETCSDPTGECCRGGVCTVTTEGNCADGNWTVTGTCSPNPCPDTPRVLSFF